MFACSSILQPLKENLSGVLQCIGRTIVPGGTLYVSFKHGNRAGTRDGRHFADFIEGSLHIFVASSRKLAFEDTRPSQDTPPLKKMDSQWVNTMLRKLTGQASHAYEHHMRQTIVDCIDLPRSQTVALERPMPETNNSPLVVTNDELKASQFERVLGNFTTNCKTHFSKEVFDAVISGETYVTRDQIAARSFALAWYAVLSFRLNLGAIDLFARMVDMAHDRLALRYVMGYVLCKATAFL